MESWTQMETCPAHVLHKQLALRIIDLDGDMFCPCHPRYTFIEICSIGLRAQALQPLKGA